MKGSKTHHNLDAVFKTDDPLRHHIFVFDRAPSDADNEEREGYFGSRCLRRESEFTCRQHKTHGKARSRKN